MSVSSTPNSISKRVDMETCYDQVRHVESFRLKEDSPHPSGGVSFTPMLPWGSIDGFYPKSFTDKCTLGSNGPKDSGSRGFRVVDYTLKSGGAKGQFLSLSLGIGREGQCISDMMSGCIDRFVQMHPTSETAWYQSTFPELDDGTKVFLATKCLNNPKEYQYMTVEGEGQWDSPQKTWGPFVYGSDDEVRMYVNLSVEQTVHVLKCFDEKKKKMSKKEHNSVVVYPRDGIPLSNFTQLKPFLDSEFYKKTRWTARVLARISRVVFKCGIVGRHPTSENAIYGIYPVFKFKTESDILLTETTSVMSNMLDEDTLEVARNLVLYEGLPMPTKKRKRATAVKKIFGAPAVHDVDSDEEKNDAVVAESEGEE